MHLRTLRGGQLLALSGCEGVVEHVARRADASAARPGAFELLDLGNNKIVRLVLQALTHSLDLRLPEQTLLYQSRKGDAADSELKLAR